MAMELTVDAGTPVLTTTGKRRPWLCPFHLLTAVDPFANRG